MLQNRPDFGRLWILLKEWLIGEYVEAYFYADAVSEMVNEVASNGTSIDFNLLRLRHEDRPMSMSASLSQMHATLRDFFDVVAPDGIGISNQELGGTQIPTTLFDSIDRMLESERTSEQQFQETFSSEPWPITQPIRL